LNFDISTLSFHVPTSSLCASAMRGSIVTAMANDGAETVGLDPLEYGRKARPCLDGIRPVTGVS
jgi:hypothetical protein